ncbi:hypothetical protein [Sulfurovum sp.]|uniref:hypothetical protein n=1 Tax=Sulfurovum sp. TaxID=1969726 RepID=UPI0025D31C22|nr:hypothetical protein [Sulfurovum sp.]
MRIVIQKILLSVLLLIVSGSATYAAGAESEIQQIEKQFSYQNYLVKKEKDKLDKPRKEECKREEAKYVAFEHLRLALIKNNLQYVLVTAGMYAFALIIIIILMRMTPDHQAKDLVTIIGLVSVIFGTILLVLVVDTTDTLTAPMGILGAIAGYLFGAVQKKEKPEK